MTKMVTLMHDDGDKQTVVSCSLRYYELRHMGYKECPTLKSEGLTEEDLYNADDLINSQQRSLINM